MLGLNTTLPDHKGALLEEKESLTALEILEWNCSRRVTWSSCCWSTNLVEMETYSHPQRDRKEQLILLQWWHILINYCYIFLVVSISKYTFIIYIYAGIVTKISSFIIQERNPLAIWQSPARTTNTPIAEIMFKLWLMPLHAAVMVSRARFGKTSTIWHRSWELNYLMAFRCLYWSLNLDDLWLFGVTFG